MPSEYQHATARPASLEEETRTVIGEARMVLPGIQAFFGFQLIAVFNNRFQDLTHTEQVLHLIALLLLAVSIALIMTPAAYHRIAERGMVSRRCRYRYDPEVLWLVVSLSLDSETVRQTRTQRQS
jgi:Family of unknown function (DUF6328)